MADLELTRTPENRRLYALEGVGTLGLQGFVSRSASAEAAGTRWRITVRPAAGASATRSPMAIVS